jgi:hypothetical protein
MDGSLGVAYFDTRMEGGSVRGTVSAAGNVEINITGQRACRLLCVCVCAWAGRQPAMPIHAQYKEIYVRVLNMRNRSATRKESNPSSHHQLCSTGIN